jgi:hypothetical protein
VLLVVQAAAASAAAVELLTHMAAAEAATQVAEEAQTRPHTQVVVVDHSKLELISHTLVIALVTATSKSLDYKTAVLTVI